MKKVAQALFKPHLEPGEEIIDVFHRHPFVMLPSLGRILFFAFLVPLFLYYMFPEFVLFFALWMLAGVIRIIYLVFNWYHDALLATSVSLLKTYWNGFFDRSSSRLEYPMMEGISYTIQGFRRTVFNYGHVHVNRSGGSSLLELPDAINPPKVERLILTQQEKFTSSQGMQDSETLKSLLVTMIREHNKNNPPHLKVAGVTEKPHPVEVKSQPKTAPKLPLRMPIPRGPSVPKKQQ